VQLTTGSRLRSTVCTAEIIVIGAPAIDVDLRCGGAPMTADVVDGLVRSGEPAAPFDEGSLLGKRYVDEEASVEVLCTRAGSGSLSIGERGLSTRVPKPLPSSD
jgi:hypothetical protein